METLLKVVDLKKTFHINKVKSSGEVQKILRAVDGLNFDVYKGETFGIVGESGCGKSTLSRLILRLLEPTSGKIIYKGQDIQYFNKSEMRNYRRQAQMIFQDPYSSLNPRMNIFDIVAEPLYVHKIFRSRKEIEEKVKDALANVELPATEEFMKKLPEEISGGQRQRIGIARSLITGVEFVIADEPVSMLDTTIKAKIITLLEGLKSKLNLTYIFITHEIGIAYYVCDRIAVMYLGQIMELGSSNEIIKAPRHPYTKLLMEAVPPLYPDENWGNSIVGKDAYQSIYSGKGCRFFPRCPFAKEICKEEEPALTEVEKNYFLRCHEKH